MAASDNCAVLYGKGEDLFKLMSTRSTSKQWGEWLRAPLEHALAGNDEDLALALLEAGVNVGAGWEGCDGRTLLDAAVEGGNEDLVSTILKAGGRADLDVMSGDDKMTALHRASKGGHTAVTRMLVLAGANVSLKDSSGRTALHYALEGGHRELAVEVVIAGANLNAMDVSGDTPLHIAAAQGLHEFVCTLLRKGVRVGAANTIGQCALHMAVQNNHLASTEALLEAGADPNRGYGNVRQCTPLVLASCNVAITNLLLKHGADAKASDGVGFTALHWAGRSGRPGVINALVEAGADLEAESARVICYEQRYEFKGLTPLHAAALHKTVKTMPSLLDNGADINAKDDNGNTPLHVVCMTSADKWRVHAAAELLLRRGADETITSDDGYTPIELIDSNADPTGRLKRLLAKARGDRAWRRRGTLVLCRAYTERRLGDVGNRRTGTISCKGRRIETSVAYVGGAGAAGLGNKWAGVVVRAVEVDAEAVFRAIVGFL